VSDAAAVADTLDVPGAAKLGVNGGVDSADGEPDSDAIDVVVDNGDDDCVCVAAAVSSTVSDTLDVLDDGVVLKVPDADELGDAVADGVDEGVGDDDCVTVVMANVVGVPLGDADAIGDSDVGAPALGVVLGVDMDDQVPETDELDDIDSGDDSYSDRIAIAVIAATVALGVGVGVEKLDTLGDGVGVDDRLSCGVGVTKPDCVGVVLEAGPVLANDALGDCEDVPSGVAVLDGVSLALKVGDCDVVTKMVAERVRLGTLELLEDEDTVGVGVGVGNDDAVAERVGLGVLDLLEDEDGVDVGVGVGEVVAVGVDVGVDDTFVLAVDDAVGVVDASTTIETTVTRPLTPAAVATQVEPVTVTRVRFANEEPPPPPPPLPVAVTTPPPPP
jgi:hypothetical protein